MAEFNDYIDPAELNRLQERFVTRSRALSILRICLLGISQLFFFEPLMAFCVLAIILCSSLFAGIPKWGHFCVFASLNIELIWHAYAISQTGFFQSPLIAALPALTLLFTILFHKPSVIL